jgi:NitT/TauT family transport system substrate-binding protein
LLHKDRNLKRTSDTKLHNAAAIIARYVNPGSHCHRGRGQRLFIGPQARRDVAEVERQIAWYKAQGLIDKGVIARDVVDLNFVKCRFLRSGEFPPLPASPWPETII